MGDISVWENAGNETALTAKAAELVISISRRFGRKPVVLDIRVILFPSIV
jgi:hypothetical protein